MRKRAATVLALSAILFGSSVDAADFLPSATRPGAPGVLFCPPSGCDSPDFLNSAPPPGMTSGQAYAALGHPEPQPDGDGILENDRVPWWKGGMWRNRGRDGGGASGGGSRGSGGSSNRASDDDMWDDDYDGYDDDADYGGSASRSSGFNDFEYDDEYADDPYATPDFGSDEDFDSPYGMAGAGSRGGSAPVPPSPGPHGDMGGFDDPYADSGFGGGAGMGGAPSYSAPGQSYGGDPYSSGSYTAGTYAEPYNPSPVSTYDPNYLDTSVYAGPTRVEDTVVTTTTGSAEGTASFLEGTPYAGMSYTQPVPNTYATGAYTEGSQPYATGTVYDAPNATPSAPYSVGPVVTSAPVPVYGGTDVYTVPSAVSTAPMPAPADMMPGPSAPPPAFRAQPSPDAQGSPQFENAVRLVKDNRFSEAKNILAVETGRNPSNAAAWRWLADCYYNLLELDDAINAYQRSLERDPSDYYALRGQGFAYLHRGHEYWRRMQEEVARGEKDAAATTFAHAHDNYKKSLELLGLCLRRAPNDGEAIYGEAMAAEGASRKLYSNAISYLKLGPEHRERAELFAENCLTVINKGIERARERARQNPGDAGPRALLGGLYLRKAILYNQLGRKDMALAELRNSRDVQQSILDEIDKNNATARKNIREAEIYWDRWGGNQE